MLVAVGPEGGWLDSELKELETEQGFEFFTLGDKVLRCETAVVSVMSQVCLVVFRGRVLRESMLMHRHCSPA